MSDLIDDVKADVKVCSSCDTRFQAECVGNLVGRVPLIAQTIVGGLPGGGFQLRALAFPFDVPDWDTRQTDCSRRLLPAKVLFFWPTTYL